MINIQLYNKTKNNTGYISRDGRILNDLDAYWVTTDYMQVTPGSKCTYNGLSYIGANQYGAYYDKKQNFIGTFELKTADNNITIPKDVYYVRFSICRRTKINLFSQPLEIGSINETSGSNEAGDTFRRTAGFIEISSSGFADLRPGDTYTISTTEKVLQMAFYYYRETLDHSTIYSSYTETEFNKEVDKVTFTIPSINGLNNLRVRFYNPNNLDFKVMLNEGDFALPYAEYAEASRDDTNTFNFYILAEAYEGFRAELYSWIKETLSENLTEGDLDIIIKLMCYIFGDLSGLVYNLKEQIDPDLAEEAYLRHLGSVIGYEWNMALTADQQREAMKLYVELQKKRGTIFSLKNLIAVFGQDRNSYYSTSDLRGVNIIEGGKNGEPVGTKDSNGLFPGDIMIEIPQFSNILIKAIDNIRLIGTRLFFTYVIYCGPFKIPIIGDSGKELNIFFDPASWGYNPTIEEFTNIVKEETESDKIENILDWPLLNTVVRNCTANTSCVVYTAYKKPFEKGFIWNTPSKTDYQGFLIDEETLKEEDTMYGYGHAE